MSRIFIQRYHNKLLGILILMAAVLFGIILVKQDQDFRNKAKSIDARVIICHKNTVADTWQEMYVNYEELNSHLNHGDILGGCSLITPTNSNINTLKN
jgi:hypothetical protein